MMYSFVCFDSSGKVNHSKVSIKTCFCQFYSHGSPDEVSIIVKYARCLSPTPVHPYIPFKSDVTFLEITAIFEKYTFI
jgi:hypothetical protein